MKQNHGSKRFLTRLLTIMCIISVLQLVTFMSVLFFGGEFSHIRQYAYNVFVEKNANRGISAENMLTDKAEAVQIASSEIINLTERILAERRQTAGHLQTDKGLGRTILKQSLSVLITMLRQNQVNDAYILLDSGTLYDNENSHKIAGIYIRDIDPKQNDLKHNNDILMEIGSSELAKEAGITLDSEWVAQLDVTDQTGRDFYYQVLETARANPDLSAYHLGYWSTFSGLTDYGLAVMRYTLPLIHSDGTVYGVIGIGLTDKMITDLFPSGDRMGKDICYILGCDADQSGVYQPQLHSGAVYGQLVNSGTKFDLSHRIEGDVYDFNSETNISSVGNIHKITLYDSASPYRYMNWAMIAVGRKSSILTIYNGLVNMFVISTIVSLCISLAGGFMISRRLTVPVAKMIRELANWGRETNDTVHFESSSITEIDQLGDAIALLQVNVQENSSRVSRLISMVDMGIGVFLYDYNSDTVFVSQSLTRLLHFDELPPDSDSTVAFSVFKQYLSRIDSKDEICGDDIFSRYAHDGMKNDITLSYSDPVNKEETWLKFSLSKDKSNIICLVQDITAVVLEKRRIEYERDYDVNTGLLNRRAYLAALERMFLYPERLKIAAVVMIDLDNLKYVNDTYGHDFGDHYIKKAASVFQYCAEFGGIVSHLSGDEFNIFLSGFDSKEEIREIIKNLQIKLRDSYCLLADGTRYRIRCSSGIAWYPENATSYEILMKYADFAMYTIKHSTKGKFAEFDLEVYKRDSILLTGIEEMNSIMDGERIRFAFQPVVSAKTGDIFGYELLMRPLSDILRTPLDFIRLAKTSSKLYEIERLTFVKGIAAFREQQEKGAIAKGAKIFINSLSNCMVSEIDLDYIETQYQDMLSDIMLEILEGEEENEEYTAAKKQLIKRWNAMLALDDFGTGYNGETLMLKLSPDLIKIDRSLISNCDNDGGKRKILINIINSAKSKNCLVLAEGVETAGELKTVIRCGVDFIQGYYVDCPLFDPVPLKQEVVAEIRRIYESFLP